MKKTPKILYVEDDSYLGFVTKDNLQIKGYDITLCRDGNEALEHFNHTSFSLCILDVMLPEMDGFTLAKKIREMDEHIPIIFLSAKSMKEDRIEGLSIGGDDYLTKPFSIEELSLKIEIFLKRSRVSANSTQKGEMVIGEYILDPVNMVLSHHAGERRLTSRENELLRYFAENINNVLKKEEILTNVWGSDSYLNSRSLDVFVSKLRKYLKHDTSIKLNNIHGIGFIMAIN